MAIIQRASVLRQFSCLGEACPDTCCKGWNMQLDAPTHEKYVREAPELLDAVADDGQGGTIMRRDAKTDFCVKFDNGLCGIHGQYGTAFLGDACHFYPRVTRSLGNITLMTATPSCPEIARLALTEAFPAALGAESVDRLPDALKNYLPEGLSSEDALAVHEAFLAVADEDIPTATAFARIQSVARSLERLPTTSWKEAVSFYLSSADARVPAAESVAEDPFNLLQALCGLAVAAHKKPSTALMETIAAMEALLGATLDWQQAGITTREDSLQRFQEFSRVWAKNYAPQADTLLSRWLALQLSVALFPFAGLGGSFSQRITIIGVRLATFRLALMALTAAQGGLPDASQAARAGYAIARILDHLAEPDFSLNVYTDAGWLKEARLNGLLQS